MPIELQTAPATGPTKSARKRAGPRTQLFASQKIGDRDRMAFTERLALLLETGTPLHGALQALRQQAGSPAMQAMIGELAADVETGQRFSQALARHPEVFSTTYTNLVAASEGGGFMHEVLEQLLTEEQKREELRNTIVSALTYPAFLTLFSVGVVVFVLVVVFPKFGEMFARIHDQLPATTIALMWLSDMMRQYWWQLLAATGLIGVGIVRGLSSAAGRNFVDGLKLRMPGLRDVFVQLYLTQSLRVMGLSLGHGVPIVEALRSTRDVVKNRIFRDLFVSVELSVQEGNTITSAFEQSDFIPDLVKQMIGTAEASGSLAPVLGRVAEHYERELGRKLATLSKLAEPVMLLIMGVLVGVIVSSLILPIFKLSKAVT
jgi:type II secretory pathway component PulF